ncbi:hypothetical protein ACJIZ3_025855 [Penstemon smallii]|uniref:DUF7780 domain-containing protein n=1 Tax=Penstemon smallii TaxID=265156 RepID=A0ABD3TVT5_9LAMI
MGFTTKIKNSSSNSEGWGMGFLLVFFPEENHNHNHLQQESNHTNNLISKNKNLQNFNFFSSPLKRANSSHLLLKSQSTTTISICLLLLFTSLLLFTLSALPTAAVNRRGPPRRHLHDELISTATSTSTSNLSHALQGMGTLYRRGTQAMNDLIVAHAVESLTLHDFKLFLRLLYRSTLTSKSDLLFVFPSKTVAFENAILQENDSFFKLVTQYLDNDRNSTERSNFDVTQFVNMSKKEKESGEPIWGRRIRGNFSEDESTRPSYGSVVGFDVEELDPENSLSGFLDHVPMNLRRWACYPMLLGRVRRNFKHVMLVDMKEFLVVGDPLGRVRNRSPESVLLKVWNPSGKHGKKNSEKTRVNPGVVMGGSRGVRRLSNTMLSDIVRSTMQHKKKKNPVSEAGLLNQLVGNEYVSKNVNFILLTESVPELGSLIGSNKKLGSQLLTSNHTVLIRRGNSNLDANSVVMKHICSFPIDSTVYSDC